MTLEEKLSGWTGPSSSTEQDKQVRTKRMIQEAVKDHAAFDNYKINVYTKGSYANGTNVRTDSDVDIAVQCGESIYWNEETPGLRKLGKSYAGIWTPAKLRSELKTALEAKFPGQVDDSGSTAFRIECSTARVEADVVPCFDYHYYFNSGSHHQGAKVFKKNGTSLENYPQQQLDRGTAKNGATSLRYKKAVRIMKRLENAMVATDAHCEVPSFFVECLVYNCPNTVLERPTWTEVVRGIIVHIWEGLEGSEPSTNSERWLEVSECKYLFHSAQAWDRQGGRDFAQAAWTYLGYKP